jgi:hypothetical protein
MFRRYWSQTEYNAREMRPRDADFTRLITFPDFLANDQRLECFCPGCKRTAYTDVNMLVTLGLGDRQVKRCWPRCRKCGSLGIWSFTGP